MQLIGLIFGIFSMLGMFVAFIPFLGWMNWGVIPFAFAGLAISIISVATARGFRGLGIAGIVMCSLAIIAGTVRLKIGCGIF